MDTMIQKFLADGGYVSVKEWMLDSDYTLVKHVDGSDIWLDDQRNRVDPIGCIEGAIEASGFSSDEKIHADNTQGNTLCGLALRACSDDRVTDNDEEVNCWECRSML